MLGGLPWQLELSAACAAAPEQPLGWPCILMQPWTPPFVGSVSPQHPQPSSLGSSRGALSGSGSSCLLGLKP